MITNIKDLEQYEGKTVRLQGWVANKRTGKGLVFLVLRDGSGYCQCVVSEEQVSNETFETAKRATQESSLQLSGAVIKDERQVGGYEIQVQEINILQETVDYPISNKEHGVDFLIENRHLWLRSRKQWAIMRIRNSVKYAIYTFFHERGFIQIDSPIFTGNAAEGTTTLFETDYYGQPAYLAQTGQLYGEAAAMAHGKVYTFGPTFRAEKSKTRRHLSEFWMIEPEMAFYDLDMDMDLIEDFIRYIVTDTYKNCKQELEILERDTALFENIGKKFPRITYDEAVQILRGERDVNGKNSIETLRDDLNEIAQRIGDIKEEISTREATIQQAGVKAGVKNFNQAKVDNLKNELRDLEEKQRNIPQWIDSALNFTHGDDFGGSDETVITRLFNTPIMVYKWPAAIKAFYMKRDEQDSEYVKGVDCLAPEGFGEIVGGSQREEDIDLLLARIKEHQLPEEVFNWYIDLRRYGSVPHSGFGLGFERLIMWLTNVPHIRETIPFPRYYGRLFP
ncbi:MAG: asparagine--tRNA ligase [Chitinophagales bacterium]|nr:asparagine--tRNA ligase [Bacteroidota bacterium]MCB9043883.1 asparagine--tRNA ligase [Chitinophagales bacterium]